jgi:hypothetical protein
MTRYCHNSETYATAMGSDVGRDGMYLELERVGTSGPGTIVAEAFWADESSTFTLTLFEENLAVSLIEQFLGEARRRITPIGIAEELNIYRPEA